MQAELRPGRGGDVAAEPWIAEVLELAGNPPESPDVAARVPGGGQAAGQIGGPWPGRGDAGRDKADQDGHVEGDRMAGHRAVRWPGGDDAVRDKADQDGHVGGGRMAGHRADPEKAVRARTT